jgi:DNA-binding transcriptional ArsR family regulator
MVITRSAEFVNNDGDKIQFYEPIEIQIEEPFRALQQLRVLVRALAIVQQKTVIGAEELRIAKDVALSSMPADRSLLLSVILTEDKEWSAKEISQNLGISHRTALRQLDELVSLKILTKREQGNGLSNLYQIEQSFRRLLYDTVDFVSHPPVEETVTETPRRTVADMSNDEILSALTGDISAATSQLSLEGAIS